LGAIQALADHAPPQTAVVCALNGLESERIALRFFEHVYGAYVSVFSAFTEPGIVSSYSHPSYGIIDIGCYPRGLNERAHQIASDLQAGGFCSLARDDVMAWKRSKLIINMGNAANALCGRSPGLEDIVDAARREAEACFAAGGLSYIPLTELSARSKHRAESRMIDGSSFPGSSTLQGMARGRTTTEGDYLNGEVVLAGRQLGIATPVNGALQQIIREVAYAGTRGALGG
jgi:2-dehydropantoate 2-reductase